MEISRLLDHYLVYHWLGNTPQETCLVIIAFLNPWSRTTGMVLGLKVSVDLKELIVGGCELITLFTAQQWVIS